jgi:hypothetical protein
MKKMGILASACVLQMCEGVLHARVDAGKLQRSMGAPHLALLDSRRQAPHRC